MEDGFARLVGKTNVFKLKAKRLGTVKEFRIFGTDNFGLETNEFKIAREKKVVFVKAGHVGKKSGHDILELTDSAGEHGEVANSDAAKDGLKRGKKSNKVIDEGAKNVQKKAVEILFLRKGFIFEDKLVIHGVEFANKIVFEVENFDFFGRVLVG